MIARLGAEAADALDEFLAAALSYESYEAPSLHGFLSFLRRADAEIKRDLEAEGNAVRVMTVHGVKGLEAPVVVLADTTTLPHASKDPKVVPVARDDAPEGSLPALIWAMRKEDSSAKLNGARDKARDLRLQEYRRLLYVALTRAADALVVCGYLNKKQKEPEKGSWYDLVDSALAKDSAQITEHDVIYSDEKILRWGTPAFETVAAADVAQPQPARELPGWLGTAWKQPGGEHKKLRPSLTTRGARAKEAAESKGGRTRGILLHRLLQSLPELPASEREVAALRYLKQAAPDLPKASQAALAAEALRVIADPACGKLFGSGSRAEPELIALIEDVEISARLDRILVEGDEVIFADFKSDAAVPASEAAIPSHYVTQLAAYRAALLKTYPGKRIRALLVFTAAPRIFEIPEESLESAWRGRKTQGSPAFA
jgi:ATP-dependent helicase/nuclease subunit A